MSITDYVPRRVVLRLRMDVSPDDVRACIAHHGHEIAFESLRRPPRRLIVVLVPEGTEDAWVATYAGHPSVTEATRDHSQSMTD